MKLSVTRSFTDRHPLRMALSTQEANLKNFQSKVSSTQSWWMKLCRLKQQEWRRFHQQWRNIPSAKFKTWRARSNPMTKRPRHIESIKRTPRARSSLNCTQLWKYWTPTSKKSHVTAKTDSSSSRKSSKPLIAPSEIRSSTFGIK